MKGREFRPKRERMSVILRAEEEGIQFVLQNERIELDTAIVRPGHNFDASLHIKTAKFIAASNVWLRGGL